MNVLLLALLALVCLISLVRAAEEEHLEYYSGGSTTTCGGNCPSGDCVACPCGTSANTVDIAAMCAQYSWNQANCQCIMNAESGGNANAVNYNTNESTDVGLWQINSFNWAACAGGSAPCNPSTNLACAIDVYNWGGNTWKLW